jgi:hypothetical protein
MIVLIFFYAHTCALASSEKKAQYFHIGNTDRVHLVLCALFALEYRNRGIKSIFKIMFWAWEGDTLAFSP